MIQKFENEMEMLFAERTRIAVGSETTLRNIMCRMDWTFGDDFFSFDEAGRNVPEETRIYEHLLGLHYSSEEILDVMPIIRDVAYAALIWAYSRMVH